MESTNLQDLTGDVERQVAGIDDTLHEGQVPWHEAVIELVADEDALHVEPDAVALLVEVLHAANR